MGFAMDDWLELVCPACKAALVDVDAPASLACAACGATWPIEHGIPDLRTRPDPYISRLGDVAKARALHREFGTRDFAGIIELYYAMTPEVPEPQARLNASRMLGGIARAKVALASWEDDVGPLGSMGRVLDIGCGEAPLVIAAARRGAQAVGVDIGFRHITMGLKQVEQERLRAPLIAACAEALPFPDASFDVVTIMHALELFRDQPRALAEAFRVTRPGGRVLVSAPNRTSVGPDPHIGLPAGGLLPNALVGLVSRLQMARPPHRSFLTAGGLRRALVRAGFSEVRVGIPGLSDSQRAQFTGLLRVAADGYERLRTAPGARTVLRTIGPLLQASAVKPR
ncbi:MAG: methyltransferase domain-containing protein [Gemmatimonadaceae bacterium]|nr:methyltransferase domain-containing protein [Gemmatimonadaceae bacterium]